MLTKSEQAVLNDEHMEAYCRSISRYANLGYKFMMSKTDTRPNPKSKIPGGCIIFVVDHINKLEIAYPYIKNADLYIGIIYENRENPANYIKNLGEIYTGNHRDNKLKDYYKNGKFV